MDQQNIGDISNFIDERLVSDISIAISKAYKANHRAFLEDNTLSCSTAKDYRPHMLRTRVDYFLEQIKHPKMNTFVRYNRNNSCRYLEITIGNLILTQNTVKNPEQPPRPAKFRYKLQSQHGQYCFEFLKDNVKITEVNGKIYLQLIHGGHGDEPSFIKLGTEVKKDEWLCFFDFPVTSLGQKDIEEIDDARHPSRKETEKTGEDDNGE